jgi:magnesium chelatase subunit D
MKKRAKRVVMPFTALVGQEPLKRALVLNAINPSLYGVLIRGEKGTAKSTAVRALAELLPEIEVAKCRFQCSPFDSALQCDECNAKHRRTEEIPYESRKVRVVDLPLGATEDRLVGTLDIEKALKEGIKALQPGLLAEVNRGILYIDEVNLLDDHLVDALLDAAAMGVNIIEREGVSLSHPSRFILVGTMNPEEGDLRPQLLDRFGLAVDVTGVADVEGRMEIVEVVEDFERDPLAFSKRYEEAQTKLRDRIVSARELLGEVRISEELVRKIVDLCIELGVHGHRADFLMARTARTIAAFHQRREVKEGDVKEAAEFVLPHRMRRKPFEEPKPFIETVQRVVMPEPKEQQRTEPREQQDEGEGGDQTKGAYDDLVNHNDAGGMAERRFEVGELQRPEIRLGRDRRMRRGSGRRIETLTTCGKYIKARMPQGPAQDIAFDATMRASIARTGRLKVAPEDLREKVRQRKTFSVIAFVVDGSGSMGGEQRMEAAKGAVMSLLEEAYQKRDRVSFITFRRNKAEILLPPTSSVDLAAKCLQELPTGGKTPLPDGMYKGLMVLRREKRKREGIVPIMVLVSDCRGNVPIETDVRQEVISLSREINEEGIHLVIVDSEDERRDLGYSEEIIDASGGTYYHLDNLDSQGMVGVIKPLTEAAGDS